MNKLKQDIERLKINEIIKNIKYYCQNGENEMSFIKHFPVFFTFSNIQILPKPIAINAAGVEQLFSKFKFYNFKIKTIFLQFQK